MPIVVSDELLRSIGMSEEEVRGELAVLLFEKGRCTLAQASRLAGMSRIGFQKILQARGIPIHYGTDEFRRDLDNLRVAGLL
jgi:predicted HTH domain antitoxin